MHIISSNQKDIDRIYRAQKDFFSKGETQSYTFRKRQLELLKKVIHQNEAYIIAALQADFKKPPFETYATEIGFWYEEVNVILKNLKAWMKPQKVNTPITSWPSSSYIVPQPKGLSLIIAPWNYPFQLLMGPLVASIAAGNVVLMKAPEQTPHLSLLVGKLIHEHFDESYIALLQGPGAEIIPPLLQNHRFDHVFFTGSTSVGRKISEMVAPHLTPLTLELGGKSPAIVDQSADLKVAARRIAFGKWVNAGQTCVAPDYLIVHETIYEAFIHQLKKTIREFYGEDPLQSENLASIINEKHFEVLIGYLSKGEIIFGGRANKEKLRIEPTLLQKPGLNDSIMQKEIFGPILPILSFYNLKEVQDIIAHNPYPLALYIFTKSKKSEQQIIQNVAFGGGAVNNAIVHLSNPNLPFGGVGYSGFGNYHGKAGFNTFSHAKSIMKSATWLDIPQKYPPYSSFALKMIRRIMK